jgi:hypothetical protein
LAIDRVINHDFKGIFMIKKLFLLLSLGLATPAPVVAAYPSRSDAQTLLSFTAVCAIVAGTVCIMANNPEFSRAFGRALLEVLTDRRHYHHCHSFWCDCYYPRSSVSVTYHY